jgi:hypothetical protein
MLVLFILMILDCREEEDTMIYLDSTIVFARSGYQLKPLLYHTGYILCLSN